jgi:hypothetical protein
VSTAAGPEQRNNLESMRRHPIRTGCGCIGILVGAFVVLAVVVALLPGLAENETRGPRPL